MTDPIDSTGEPSIPPTSGKFESVRLLLRRLDGRAFECETDERAMHSDSLVEHEGVLYAYRGTDQIDGRWFRIYRESPVIQLRTMKKGR